MLEGGFDLLLQLRLAQDRFLVALRGAFEEGARVGGHLPDGLEFAQAQEAREVERIALVLLVGMRADELVVPRVADDELLHVRAQQLPEPAGQVGFLQGQSLVARGDGLHLRDELVALRGQAPETALGAVVVELGKDAILGVRIQPQPGYG